MTAAAVPGRDVLRDWVERTAREAPDRLALVGPDGSLTYAELDARARVLAASFKGLGLARGDVIAAQLPNGVAFVLSYLAAGYLGAILQTIHMPYRAAEVAPLLRHGAAAAVICVDRTKDLAPAELMLGLRAQLPALRHVIALGEHGPAAAIPFTRLLESGDGSTALARPAPTDRFLLLYTSGTTSAPKGVPVSYAKFLANARLCAPELGIEGRSVLLSAAPFTHLYGLFSINLALAAGATMALLPAYTPAALADALDAYRPTGLFVAPAHLAACLNAGLLEGERLASLAFMLISGSTCPQELARTLQERMPHGKALQLWGMSEMQAGSFTRPGDPPEVRLSTTGRASPGTELRIADGDRPLAEGVEGELQARGLSVFDSYLGDEAATASAFTADGWFRTGDLARMDRHGNISITGRLKDVINRGGVKFNPADIEALIGRHPAVAQCAIVPMPDPVLGERACCFVVPAEPGRAIGLEDLCAWLAGHEIAKLKWPEHLELIDAMPMTPTRKIRKAELAEHVAKKRIGRPE